MAIEINSVGVWSGQHGWHASLGEVAAELEEWGYGAFWLGVSPPGDLRLVEELLAGTTSMTIATGIVNVWSNEPHDVAAAYQRVSAAYPGRFLLGIGAGHRELDGDRYQKPYQRLVEYLDVFDGANVPADHRVLAALGPKMLALASARSAGAHPYLTTPEHTRRAREILGEDRLLAPELMVVLDSDPDRARALARQTMALYLQLPNYTNNLRRLGFAETEFADGGSDRLIDELVAWGDEEAVAAKIGAHHQAGADHVAIQVLNPDRRAALRALASSVTALSR